MCSFMALVAMAPLAWAGGPTLYEDPETHQVFTEPGEGRVPLEAEEKSDKVASLRDEAAENILRSALFGTDLEGEYHLSLGDVVYFGLAPLTKLESG